MCGIFCYLGNKTIKYYDSLINEANKIRARGPDNTKHLLINENIFFSFHRLSINGLNDESNQPFINENIYLICNGEIFNYKELIETHHLKDEYKTDSDCEIILHLYKKYGIKETCVLLDGEFSFILYDANINKTFVARDHLGIRALYLGTKQDEMIFSSELKAIDDSYETSQFPPRFYLEINNNDINQKTYVPYFTFDNEINTVFESDENEIIQNIRELFTKAVEKRLLSDRNIGCLLSGGLDSTTIVALVSKYYEPYKLNTYSIGLKGSVDLKYAQNAADFFKTKHTSIEVSNEDFLNSIEKTIKQIESYDVTTVRASVGNYLVSLYIRDNSQDKVIFCGDVSDEIFGSYRGFYYAPTDKDFYTANMEMLKNIHYFDVLRSDKSISGAGLEARVPFSDKEFVKYVMKIDPKLKQFNEKRIEKYLFRIAFEDIMPYDLVWRPKTAFSDGVGCAENPWNQTIKNHMDKKYTDNEFKELCKKYIINPPYDKESLYYREIFESYYPNKDTTIPYFWKQPFMNEQDPSAWQAENNLLNKDKFKKFKDISYST